MGFAIAWICLALVCAVGVLIGAGRALGSTSSKENVTSSQWHTWKDDFVTSSAPLGIRIEIGMLKLLRLLGRKSDRLPHLESQLEEIRAERRRERELAKLVAMNERESEDTSLEEFLRATQTSEPAYVEVEALSEKLEFLYDTVQERRASARARR